MHQRLLDLTWMITVLPLRPVEARVPIHVVCCRVALSALPGVSWRFASFEAS